MEIKKYNPCREAMEFRLQYETFEQAWNACPRGDWMLWIAQKAGVDKRLLTLAKGKCAETVIHLMKDKRSVAAVQAAIAYGSGKITDIELRDIAADAYAAYAAADAAYAAAAAADAAADAAAAAAAAYAAAAAADAAADAAAYAADAAAYAAADAAADAAYTAYRKENQLKIANICREILTDEIMKLI